MSTALVFVDRPCPKCGKPGLHYASQVLTGGWCAACRKAAANQRHAEKRETLNAAMRQRRLDALLARPQAEWTRRQRGWVLRQALPPGRRFCAFCWEDKPPGSFWAYVSATWHGPDSYCISCRRIYNRLYHRRVRQLRLRQSVRDGIV